MKLILFAALAASIAASGVAGTDWNQWPQRDQETIEKTFPLTDAPQRLVVDNVHGHVHVKGVAGNEVRVKAQKTIYAETDSDLAQARSEVSLGMEAKPGTVTVSYNAPWRCHNEGDGCHGGSSKRFYNVVYDIDVEAPEAARLVISTVNGGDIRVDQSAGAFDIRGVNGGIEMAGISGSGNVHTVNGRVAVHFTKNPQEQSSFKSVNGGLDVWFPSDLSADLLFKTLNGQVYSDFAVTPRAIPASELTERRDGKFVYHSNGSGAARAGQGGPTLNFETVNGSVRLHRAE